MFDDNQHDETTGQQWANAPQAEPTTETAGFCQDCGRPLTPETRRTVGSGVFCEPCLQTRLNTGAPSAPSGATGTMPPLSSVPNPTTAGWLGLIPGVGAMYNGQFAKGIAHFVIFAVLSSLSDHIKLFGVLCFGWIIYQVFDAVHTARARRDGLPLPNTFGLNDIGERFSAGRWHQTTPNPAAAPAPPPAGPAATGWAPVPPTPPPTAHPQSNWAGYVPPTAFGGPAPYNAADYSAIPDYSQPQPPPSWVPAPSITPAPVPNRFPSAAIVLIGLGAVFLIANVIPSFHIDGDWTTAFVLLLAAAWSLSRRLAVAQQLRAASIATGGSYFFKVFRPAIVLTVLALLFVLQALNVATLGQTWPVMLITLGLAIFLDRIYLHAAPPMPPMPYPPAPVAPVTTTEISPETEVTR